MKKWSLLFQHFVLYTIDIAYYFKIPIVLDFVLAAFSTVNIVMLRE